MLSLFHLQISKYFPEELQTPVQQLKAYQTQFSLSYLQTIRKYYMEKNLTHFHNVLDSK